MKFENLKDEYARLFASMYVHTKWRGPVDRAALQIIANKARYKSVAEMTKVPWFIIGVIHKMEANCNFGRHLHNGDPLAARTIRVPRNRPTNGPGPFRWEVSACDALMMKSLDKITDWSIERICYEMERYNGFGYRRYHPTTLSPYLWSGTAHYARGKYVSDGKWSSTAVSSQCGAIAILARMAELDDSVTLSPPPVEVKQPEPEETTPESFVKADETQISKPAVAVGTGVAAGGAVAIPVAPDLTPVTEWQGVGETVGAAAAWASAKPLMMALIVGWIAVMMFLPKIRERLSWLR